MPDKDERARRKQILPEVWDQQRQKVQDAFPVSVLVLKSLFDFLDEKLSEADCDDTFRFTHEYIQRNTTDADRVIRCLEEKGSHCDCEVLDKVEQVVLDAVPGNDFRMEDSLNNDFHGGKLSGRFHPDFPDDVEVIVHEGGPRSSERKPERMWVRVTGCENDVFSGVVLNTPYQLRKVRQGSVITFIVPDKGEYPLLVSSRYVQERPTWRLLTPCNGCGLSELFDPPSDLVAKSFPNVTSEELNRGITFTTFCGYCGGVLVVRIKRTASYSAVRPRDGKAGPRRGVRSFLRKLRLW